MIARFGLQSSPPCCLLETSEARRRCSDLFTRAAHRPLPVAVQSFPTLEYDGIVPMIRAFLRAQPGGEPPIDAACFGVAGTSAAPHRVDDERPVESRRARRRARVRSQLRAAAERSRVDRRTRSRSCSQKSCTSCSRASRIWQAMRRCWPRAPAWANRSCSTTDTGWCPPHRKGAMPISRREMRASGSSSTG